MTIVTKVYTADPVMMAEQCRHYAVRTAIQYLLDGEPTAALELLTKSTIRCSHLDTRPLDAGRVGKRYTRSLCILLTGKPARVEFRRDS